MYNYYRDYVFMGQMVQDLLFIFASNATCGPVTTVESVLQINASLSYHIIWANQIPVQNLYC